MIDIMSVPSSAPGYLDATPWSRKKNAIKNGKIGMIRWIMNEGRYDYDKTYPVRTFDLLYELREDDLMGLINKTNGTTKILSLIKIIFEPNTFL